MSVEVPESAPNGSAEQDRSSSVQQNLFSIDQRDPQKLIRLPPTWNSGSAKQVSPGTKTELREKAKRLRRAHRKQKDIAIELGVSQPTVSRLLNVSDGADPHRMEKSREFKVSATVDTVLLAIAQGGAISARRIPKRVYYRLARCEVLKKSTVPRYYVLTIATISKLAAGRQSSFIRFCLFDILQFDKLDVDQLDAKLVKIREMWKRRRGA
ncbi:MAG: hypothetical protein JRN52_08545 [Nitrososphaerota archaeon]|nr:hypothetical protein [Nitrososphaerota archaeon]